MLKYLLSLINNEYGRFAFNADMSFRSSDIENKFWKMLDTMGYQFDGSEGGRVKGPDGEWMDANDWFGKTEAAWDKMQSQTGREPTKQDSDLIDAVVKQDISTRDFDIQVENMTPAADTTDTGAGDGTGTITDPGSTTGAAGTGKFYSTTLDREIDISNPEDWLDLLDARGLLPTKETTEFTDPDTGKTYDFTNPIQFNNYLKDFGVVPEEFESPEDAIIRLREKFEPIVGEEFKQIEQAQRQQLERSTFAQAQAGGEQVAKALGARGFTGGVLGRALRESVVTPAMEQVAETGRQIGLGTQLARQQALGQMTTQALIPTLQQQQFGRGLIAGLPGQAIGTAMQAIGLGQQPAAQAFGMAGQLFTGGQQRALQRFGIQTQAQTARRGQDIQRLLGLRQIGAQQQQLNQQPTFLESLIPSLIQAGGRVGAAALTGGATAF